MCLLRYPGGKRRAAKRIVSHLPKGIDILYSPFFGGGSVELEWLAQNPGGRVIGRDVFEPLVNFWQHILRGQGPDMAVEVHYYHRLLSKSTFYSLQNQLRAGMGTPFDRACWFYVLNRASFSGTTLSGGTGDGDRFTASSVDRLRCFEPPEGLEIRKADVFDSLRRRAERFTPDTCIYLDPPYMLEVSKLYGDRGDAHDKFDHARLRRLMSKLNDQGVKWVMSYNNCPEIHDLYNDFHREPTEWKYGMSADKDGKELLIFSNSL